MAADEPLEQLKYQTLVLKVPIHCQGCKKSVHKVLRSIDGVYKTTIDSDLHKVTVTGNVKPDTLVKKILKTGKHAEIWPEPKPNNNNNANNKKKNKSAAQPDKNPLATEDDTSENISTGEANTTNNSKKTPKPNDSPASTPEKADSTAGSSGGKKSKGKKESNGGDDGEVVAEVKKEAPAPVINMGRPQGYNFPMYPLPTPPAYRMSYSTAHPSYGAAGYFPVQQSNYVYSTDPYMGSYYVPPAAPVDDGAEDGGDICVIM